MQRVSMSVFEIQTTQPPRRQERQVNLAILRVSGFIRFLVLALRSWRLGGSIDSYEKTQQMEETET
jgi:hypothetical protein